MAKHTQGGFVMVEALITATVMTVGMLMVGQMLQLHAVAHEVRVDVPPAPPGV